MTARDELPIVSCVLGHDGRTAIVDPAGEIDYRAVAARSEAVAGALLDAGPDLLGARIGVLCEPGRDFVTALLGCWRAGGLAVPMNPSYPEAELRYVRDDAGIDVVLASPEHADLARRVVDDVRDVTSLAGGDRPGAVLPSVAVDCRAMMIYTSGTTGRPKGVVHTHRSIGAMVEGLVEAWAWSADDRILLVLPLHHVHGIVNVTLCALWAGAACEAPGGFDPLDVWDRFASRALTLFMAVPTVYTRLIAAWEDGDEEQQHVWSAGAAGLRLMVSGSAALPVSVLDRWAGITGHVLLERYGMTEIGMGLSNSLERRVRGSVGAPLPGVEVRVVDESGADVVDGAPGELLVRGDQLFREYWGRPEETAASFVDATDGGRPWFRTGDVVRRDESGFRVLGRASVDIIKTGGEKVSALEIEEVLRTHDDIRDCAVVGVADDEWGERVCAAVVTGSGAELPTDELRAWGKSRLAPFKVPSRFVFVDELPRNAMGKVTKPAVSALFD